MTGVQTCALPISLAFSRVPPEDSGDDVSVYVLQASHDISQHRLQTAFGNVGLSAHWLTIGTLLPDQRHHVVELKGFVTPEHVSFKQFIAAVGDALPQVHFLGAYAIPFTITEENI